MHIACLGVMRKMLNMWIKGDSRLSPTQRNILSNRLVLLSAYVPTEFSRKPRSLKDFERFKASGFRFILLYAGPIILKDLLSAQKYKIFLKLHISTSNNDKNLAYKCIKQFSSEIPTLYGSEEDVYNMQSIVHMAQDILTENYMHKFSCFHFENYLGQLLRLIRCSNNPLQQVIKRSVIESVEEDVILFGYAFQKMLPFYETPYSSEKVMFYKVSNLMTFEIQCTTKDIITKCIMIEKEYHFICIGILHN